MATSPTVVPVFVPLDRIHGLVSTSRLLVSRGLAGSLISHPHSLVPACTVATSSAATASKILIYGTAVEVETTSSSSPTVSSSAGVVVGWLVGLLIRRLILWGSWWMVCLCLRLLEVGRASIDCHGKSLELCLHGLKLGANAVCEGVVGGREVLKS
jgi:hypothetical protein